MSGSHASVRPVVLGAAGWAVREPPGRAVVSGCQDALVAYDDGSDLSTRAGCSGRDEVRDLHEVGIPTWPFGRWRLSHRHDYAPHRYDFAYVTSPFYYHDRMRKYDFGPGHPLKPIRLALTVELLDRLKPELEVVNPADATRADLERVHDGAYLDVVQALSDDPERVGEFPGFGFGNLDNPPFAGMYEHSMAYCGAAVEAARAINGGASRSFNIAGGLHHALAGRCSGFCIFNDPAISISVLRETFERVCYIDIDLHHGDGVQAIFYDDPAVLTASIHETGERLFPGTGFVTETGAELSSLNVPLAPYTTGDVWLRGIREGILPVVRRFDPGAIVLQAGCDAHITDPLGHLQVTVQEYLQGVQMVCELGLPVLLCGGGGYDLNNVPRMWAGATCVALGHDPEDDLLRGLHDEDLPAHSGHGREQGREHLEDVLAQIGNLFGV